jgi:tRNA pseudouridine13 synthase
MAGEFDMELPYITGELEGTGGRIREKSGHFVVEEVPLYEPSGDGGHLYVNITREGMTTREIQKMLADLFGVRVEKVGAAGMKDKNARATQTFSIEVGRTESDMLDDFLEESMEKINETLPVTVNWSRMHGNKLRTGHLLGNRFTITITDIRTEPIVALERARAITGRLMETGVPNFYGPQRFGFGGDNVAKGLAIIRGEMEVDDRWLRRLLVSSYQSYLCNRYLAARIGSGLFGRILEGDIAKKYETGGLFRVEDPAREQPRYESMEISFTAPIYGADMMEAAGPAGELEARILDESGTTMKQLAEAGAGGTRRLGRVLLKDVDIRASGGGILISFFLPKGAFATTVLREIMKTEVS